MAPEKTATEQKHDENAERYRLAADGYQATDWTRQTDEAFDRETARLRDAFEAMLATGRQVRSERQAKS